MATASQYLSGTHHKPVLVISGRNPGLVNFCVESAMSRIRNPDIRRFSARETHPQQVLEELGTPGIFGQQVLVIYEDVQVLKEWSRFEWYATRPTSGTHLILTAQQLRREDGARWIPTNSSVLYVDCGNIGESSLTKLVMSCGGLTAQRADWLIDVCQSDVDEILRILDLCDIFEDAPIETIALAGKQDSPLNVFQVLNIDDSSSLLRQLRRRFTQLARLAEGHRRHTPMMELSKNANIEPFLIKKLMPVLKDSTPEQWLSALAQLNKAISAAAQDAPGVQRYLEWSVL